MKIALYIAFNNSSSVNCCKEVIDIVSAENDIIIDSKIKNELNKELQSKFSFFDSSDPIDNNIDYVFAVGGDGTILRSITYVKDSGVPILGINAGRLGFLTSVQKENIGEAVDKIKDRLPDLVEKLRTDQNKMYWINIASSIMTTDTKPKVAYEQILIGDELVKICGIAKGSGMIAPNLATMLSFIFTNADINSNLLKTLLKRSVANSFNAITVDSDQSTNDMVTIF